MLRVKINQNEIFYEEQGNGDEIFIYVVGDRLSFGQREEMLSMFPADYHFYLLQLPLYEKSMHLKEFPVMKQWGDDVYAFSCALGLKRFIYMGISRWGQVGYQLVLNHPEVIKAFIPIVSVPISTEQRIDPGVLKALETGDSKGLLESKERDMFYPTTDKQRQLRQERWRKQNLQNNTTYNFAVERDLIARIGESRIETVPRLGEIRAPTLVLFGDKDPTNPIDQVVKSAMTIPDAKAVFFQGYSHLLSVESPEKVVDEITLFVNDLNRAEKKALS